MYVQHPALKRSSPKAREMTDVLKIIDKILKLGDVIDTAAMASLQVLIKEWRKDGLTLDK